MHIFIGVFFLNSNSKQDRKILPAAGKIKWRGKYLNGCLAYEYQDQEIGHAKIYIYVYEDEMYNGLGVREYICMSLGT